MSNPDRWKAYVTGFLEIEIPRDADDGKIAWWLQHLVDVIDVSKKADQAGYGVKIVSIKKQELFARPDRKEKTIFGVVAEQDRNPNKKSEVWRVVIAANLDLEVRDGLDDISIAYALETALDLADVSDKETRFVFDLKILAMESDDVFVRPYPRHWRPLSDKS